MKTRRYVMDKWNRAIISIKLIFVSNPEIRKQMLIAYALNSEEGRKMLGRAMGITMWRNTNKEKV